MGEEIKQWELLGKSNTFSFYYDKGGMTMTLEGIVTVWIRMVPQTVDAREKYLDDRKEAGLTLDGYQTYAFNQKLIKLNCSDSTFRIAQRVDFGEKGKVLGFHNISTEWRPIPPRSAAESLGDLFCP